MGDSTEYQTSTQNSSPWGPQKPYLKQGMRAARKMWKRPGPEYYPGSTVAKFSPEQLEGMDMASGFARDGGASEGYMKDVLAGKYNENPMEGAVFQNIQSKVMPAVNSQAMSKGRYGSGLAGGVAASEMTNAFAPVAAQMHEQGLNRMDMASRALPEMQFNRANAMYGVGQKRQAQGQAELDDSVNRWKYYQDLPYNKLSQYMSMINGNYGGKTTSMSPYHKPGLGGLFGGGLASLLGLFG